jgi:catechol 2,3-dioxygenase-like lactoylglutathione lyase family enzyme
MPALQGILETSLYVSDLNRAIAFYRDMLGLRLMAQFERERGVAMQAGPGVLLLFRAEETLKGGEFPSHGARGPGHVAFDVEPEQLPAWRKRLAECGVPIEKELSFGSNLPSIYFRDPDGNSLELAVAAIWPLEPS